MAMEFKKDYGSFEERLKLFCKPTHWEIVHGVTILDSKINDLAVDIKVVKIRKSDNTETIVIFYNGSKNSNPCWFGWIPSESQINVFSDIKAIYSATDEKNHINKYEKTN